MSYITLDNDADSGGHGHKAKNKKSSQEKTSLPKLSKKPDNKDESTHFGLSAHTNHSTF